MTAHETPAIRRLLLIGLVAAVVTVLLGELPPSSAHGSPSGGTGTGGD